MCLLSNTNTGRTGPNPGVIRDRPNSQGSARRESSDVSKAGHGQQIVIMLRDCLIQDTLQFQ